MSCKYMYSVFVYFCGCLLRFKITKKSVICQEAFVQRGLAYGRWDGRCVHLLGLKQQDGGDGAMRFLL